MSADVPPDMTVAESVTFGLAWSDRNLDGLLDWLADHDRRVRLETLRAARRVVEQQTNLADLVHFERPSDFRKGVLTCLAALDAHMAGGA